jgi:AraC-like DNA-binding protein
MHYLAQWRMQVATGLLISRIDTVARVATEVGYDSQAAFTRTFKKLVGTPPAAWRKEQMAGRAAKRHQQLRLKRSSNAADSILPKVMN